MNRGLAILSIVSLVASVGIAQGPIVATWVCDRDNFNDTSGPLLNYGGKASGRWAKDKQETTLYCDWSESQLMELEAWLAAPPPPPYTAFEVRLAVTGVTWGGPDPSNVVWFGAFSSGNDWNANESCMDLPPAAQAGACHLYADDAGGSAVPWTLPDGQPVADFWQLPELTNSVPFVGFVPTVPVDFGNMRAVVDPAVLAALISDPNVRGLRFWSEQWNDHEVYARGQWGCPGAAARIELWIPEPATLLLLGVGGLGLLRCKRR